MDSAAARRPAIVPIAVALLAAQVALTIVFTVLAMIALSSVPPSTEGLGTSWALAGVLLVANLVVAAALVAIMRGNGLARFVPLVLGGIPVVLDLVAARLTLGMALWIVAMVLLFLPAANAWFRSVRN